MGLLFLWNGFIIFMKNSYLKCIQAVQLLVSYIRNKFYTSIPWRVTDHQNFKNFDLNQSWDVNWKKSSGEK
jgi:hypothetical protein